MAIKRIRFDVNATDAYGKLQESTLKIDTIAAAASITRSFTPRALLALTDVTLDVDSNDIRYIIMYRSIITVHYVISVHGVISVHCVISARLISLTALGLFNLNGHQAIEQQQYD